VVPAAPLADFFAFDETLRTGAYVSVGDVTGDGLADLMIGAGPGGGPRVRLVDAASLLSLGGIGALDGNLAGAELGSFFSGDDSLRAGVPVAAADLDGDSLADLFTGGRGRRRLAAGVPGHAVAVDPVEPADQCGAGTVRPRPVRRPVRGLVCTTPGEPVTGTR
jgi:hypothetical protein